jgi:hypothetical protein
LTDPVASGSVPLREDIVAALAVGLAFAVGKAIVTTYVPASMARDIVISLGEVAKAHAGGERATADDQKLIDRVAKLVCSDVFVLFDDDAAGLDAGAKARVAQAVATAIVASRLDTDALVGMSLVPERLEHVFVSHLGPSIRDLGESEQASALRIARECAVAIMRSADELNDFGRLAVKRSLQLDERVLNGIQSLLRIATEDATLYESRYRAAIVHQYDRTDYFGVPELDRQQMRRALTDTFVPLPLVAIPPGTEPNRDTGPSLPNAGATGDRMPGPADIPGGVDRLLESRRTVLSGDAGTGKTTLLRWLAVRSAKATGEQMGEPAMVPFIIQLRKCHKDGPPDVGDFDKHALSPLLDTQPTGWIADVIASGRGLVLIDGIDELPQAKRGDFLAWLDGLVAAFPLARYVVSSRPAAISDEWQEFADWQADNGFVRLGVQPMGAEQVDQFIDLWYAAAADAPQMLPTTAEKSAADLKRILRRTPELRRLAANPLLCAMICYMHATYQDNLPTARAELYEECCDVLLMNRDRRRGVPLGPEYAALELDQRRAAAQFLALCMQRGATLEADVNDVDKRLDAFAARLVHVPTQPSGTSIRRLLVERTDIIREPRVGFIDFHHRTFQEYLASRKIAVEQGVDELIANVDKQEWQAVTILAAASLGERDLEKLLMALVKSDQPLAAMAAMAMATQVAEETRLLVSAEARKEIVGRLALDAGLIAAAGDLAVPLLDGSTAIHIPILGRIGSDSALDALSKISRTASDLSTALDLSLQWDNFDRSAYAERVLSNLQNVYAYSIPDWSGLEYLRETRRLFVGDADMPASEFSCGLRQLPNLEAIALGAGAVVDLEHLASSGRLEEVHLINWPAEAVEKYLPGLPAGVSRLSLSGSRQPLRVPATALESLSALRSIRLCGVLLTDPECLADLPELKEIVVELRRAGILDAPNGPPRGLTAGPLDTARTADGRIWRDEAARWIDAIATPSLKARVRCVRLGVPA